MLISVVLNGFSVTLDSNGNLFSYRSNFQFAIDWFNVVVFRLGISIQIVGECIFTRTNLCLASGYCLGCTFAFCKTISGSYGYGLRC